MARLSGSFTFGRNTLKRTVSASAEQAMRSIQLARQGVDLQVLKAEDNGTYNILRDFISFTGLLARQGNDCAVTPVGEAYERLYDQNADDAWRWLLTRSLWLYVVPNGTDAAVNREAASLGASFGLFRTVLGVLGHLYVRPGRERFLNYEELCAMLDDDANWGKDASALFSILLQRRANSTPPAPARVLLGDLENDYGIPRDNFAALFNKAFQQTGLFDYDTDGRRPIGIALSSSLDRVLQGRVRFVLDHEVVWNQTDWQAFLQLRTEDLPEEVSLTPTAVVLDEPPIEPIDGIVAAAMTSLSDAGLRVDQGMLERLVAALLTKPFVIFTGLSGSGKTKLGQAFATWLSPTLSTATRLFETGSSIDADRISYRVLASDSLSVELENPEGVRVALPFGLIEEWASCITERGFDRSTPARTIREAVAANTLYSTQLNSFETHLKASAFAKLDSRPETLPVRHHEIVSVGADWTSKESSLGFPDALNAGKYVRATPILDLILRARNDPDAPYFLILDEMNLAHVERYFADFLSALESREKISLHGMKADMDGVPSTIELPRNLFIIGTVNVDETTYVFSPKVLDRANSLEFRVDDNDMTGLLTLDSSVDLASLTGAGRGFAKAFVVEASRDLVTPPAPERLAAEIMLLFRTLSEFGAEFGYRTAREIQRFFHFHSRLVGSEWTFDSALDAQISQKVLPKLNGSKRTLEPVLCALAVLCHRSRSWDAENNQLTNSDALLSEAKRAATLEDDELHPLLSATGFQSAPALPTSFKKIKRMLSRLASEGFTSFAVS
jgi:hypothetical protein